MVASNGRRSNQHTNDELKSLQSATYPQYMQKISINNQSYNNNNRIDFCEFNFKKLSATSAATRFVVIPLNKSDPTNVLKNAAPGLHSNKNNSLPTQIHLLVDDVHRNNRIGSMYSVNNQQSRSYSWTITTSKFGQH